MGRTRPHHPRVYACRRTMEAMPGGMLASLDVKKMKRGRGGKYLKRNTQHQSPLMFIAPPSTGPRPIARTRARVDNAM
jgi:hypothetical protein